LRLPLEIVYSPKAQKQFDKLDANVAKSVIDGIRDYAIYRSPRPKPLKGGYKGFFRLRFGDYRVIAKIYDDRELFVTKVGHRSEVY
jgi:mRNA interferase RelE/StbE